jgi:hypothetical protein
MHSRLQEEGRDVLVQYREVGLRNVHRPSNSEEVCWRSVLTRFLHERLYGVEVGLPVHESFRVDAEYR